MKKSSHFKTKLVTFVVLSLASFFVLSLQLVSENLQTIFQSWGKNFQMGIYFDESASQEEVNAVLTFLKAKPHIEKVEFFEQKKSYELFKSQMASYAPEIFQDDLLIPSLPLSVQIDLDETLAAPEKQRIASELRAELQGKFKAIEDVNLGGELFARYTKIGESLQVFSFTLSALVILLSWFAVTNMMNQLISDRKEEISIHELFGASTWQIRRQFYAESILISELSVLMALSILGLIFTYGFEVLESRLGFLNLHQYLQFFSPGSLLTIFCLAPIVGLTAAQLSLRKYNSGWLASSSTTS